MSAFDPATLPTPIATYFATEDHAATAHLFALDAQVRDEGKSHSGRAEIADWLASVEARYHPRYVVNRVSSEGDRTLVSFAVSGTFPGSPVQLRQAFTVRDGLIGTLETL